VKKAIVIGLDGFEPEIVERLLMAGELPNLARLMSEGGYSRVRTTYPAQTPVAWSTFATGTNPGGHGIFDFIRRDCKTYLPDLTFTRYVQKNSFLPAKAVNLRRGTAIWELLTRAGVPSTILRFPCTFPPDEIRGRMLAGMGVPDLRGGFGTSAFYTSNPTQAQESERVVTVDGSRERIETRITGPRHPKTGNDLTTPITIYPSPGAQTAILTSEGQPGRLELRQGEWSEWMKVGFKAGPLQSVRGMIRFHLVRVSPVFELYASPINFDPNAPLFPVSSPSGYAGELSNQIGVFYTAGMPEDHSGLNNGRFDEFAFLDQCEGVLRERERMMLYELERFDRGMFFCLFDTPDRVQHMFRRFGESDHPANGGQSSPDLKKAVEEHYRRCDAIVGRAARFADDETLLIVLSDHGMKVSSAAYISIAGCAITVCLLCTRGARTLLSRTARISSFVTSTGAGLEPTPWE
jgi:predicted AlkP superfamily phosphohydrolase/phosphomutase